MKMNQLVWSFALAFVLWLVAMPTLFAREVVAMSTLSSTRSTAEATSLRFIAIGDLPYSDRETQMLRGEIAEAITQANPPFVVHYGDFKQGHWNCTDELFIASRDDIFRLRPGRVFFTPGDNDWTDCDRTDIEKPVSELERLDFMRRIFFDKPLNLPASWDYARQPNYPENARWMQNGILFATVHIVGTNNGRQEILLDDIEAALALVGEMRILIPLAGLIDKDAELQRLRKETAKQEKNIQATSSKLANPNFKDKAPPEVVNKVAQQLKEQEQKLTELQQQLAKIEQL